MLMKIFSLIKFLITYQHYSIFIILCLFLQSFITVEDMMVFSEGKAKLMKKGGVSVCIRNMTASWHGLQPQNKEGVTDNLLDQVR